MFSGRGADVPKANHGTDAGKDLGELLLRCIVRDVAHCVQTVTGMRSSQGKGGLSQSLEMREKREQRGQYTKDASLLCATRPTASRATSPAATVHLCGPTDLLTHPFLFPSPFPFSFISYFIILWKICWLGGTTRVLHVLTQGD